MATRDSQEPTHSNWDFENEQATTENVPRHSNMHDPYQSDYELLTEDDDDEDNDLYGVLQSPLTTTTQTISTTDTPLTSPATQLADSSLLQLQIQSPASTEDDTQSMP